MLVRFPASLRIAAYKATSKLLHDVVTVACFETGKDTWLPHIRSSVGRMHGHIRAYCEGGHKHTISAACYQQHMKEAKHWGKKFRPSYLKGTMPALFQGTLEPAIMKPPVPKNFI